MAPACRSTRPGISANRFIAATPPERGALAAVPPSLELTLAQAEKQHILRVYEDSDGNKSAAARRLAISRKTLERKLRSWRSPSD